MSRLFFHSTRRPLPGRLPLPRARQRVAASGQVRMLGLAGELVTFAGLVGVAAAVFYAIFLTAPETYIDPDAGVAAVRE